MRASRTSVTIATLVTLAALILVLPSGPLGAQSQGGGAAPAYKAAPADGPGAECLTPEQKETNRMLGELGHPTSGKEQSWVFNPEYFMGSWTFKRHVPDSPLGTGGEMSGKMTWKHVEGCYYEGQIEADTPDGPVKQRVQMIYAADNRYLTWIETDSRGFTLQKVGRIGGDLGGQFTHHWEVPVFLYKGHTIRMKGTTFLDASAHFIQRATISIDGEEYVSDGVMHFFKEGIGVRGR